MSEEDISDVFKKLRDWDAPDAIKGCATDEDDKTFYSKKGGCLATRGKCPYQSLQFSVTQDGNKLPACERYHPQLRKK